MKKFLFNLRAFDGEGGGAAAGAGAGAGAAGTSQAAAGNQAQGLVASDGENATHTEQSMSFDDYVKAHKDEASKWFQKQFNRRHADYNQLKSRADASAQVLDVLAAKYNLDANDVDGIVKALNGDDSMF